MSDVLIIRCDANTQIGTGHLMRCLALAQGWRERGGRVIFLTDCESYTLLQRIENEGIEVANIAKSYPSFLDWETTSRIISDHLDSWVVLDGYHFDSVYQRKVKEAGHRLLVIDDRAHLGHYYVDIVLNQNINAKEFSYSCDKDTIQLLGCKYVMLRREFLEYRGWKREIYEKAKNILVTMGGADPDNVTLKVIKVLNSLDGPNLEVKVVVGPSNPHIETMQKALLSPSASMQILQNVENMPELMAWANMAISAAGSTCWELAFMGLPAILIVTADNQREIAAGLGEYGTAVNLGWHSDVSIDQVTYSLKDLLSKNDIRKNMSKNGKGLIDGSGVNRVIDKMMAEA